VHFRKEAPSVASVPSSSSTTTLFAASPGSDWRGASSTLETSPRVGGGGAPAQRSVRAAA
jgi:hypothetical protein